MNIIPPLVAMLVGLAVMGHGLGLWRWLPMAASYVRRHPERRHLLWLELRIAILRKLARMIGGAETEMQRRERK